MQTFVVSKPKVSFKLGTMITDSHSSDSLSTAQIKSNMEGKEMSEEIQLKALEPVRIKINNKWLLLSAEFVATHPGGSVLYQYR